VAYRNGKFACEIAVAKNLNSVAGAIDDSLFAKRLFIDDCAVFECLLKGTDIDDFKLESESLIAEALLWEAAVHWHLATFKARTDALACASLLALVALTRGLAMAGTLSAAEAFAAVFRTWAGFDVVKSHDRIVGMGIGYSALIRVPCVL